MSDEMSDQRLDLQAVEDEIRRCVSLCKAQGIALKQGDIGIYAMDHQPESVCVLGAVAWVHRARLKSAGRSYVLADEVLGISYTDDQAMCLGFDGACPCQTHQEIMESPYYALGQRLAKELL